MNKFTYATHFSKGSNNMQNLKLIISVFIAIFLVGCGEQANSTTAPSEIKNPSFEEKQGNAPAGWFIDDKVANKGQITVITQNNSSLLKLTPNENNSGNELLGVGQLLDASGFINQQLEISAKMGADKEGVGIVGMHVIGDGDGFEYVQLMQKNSDSKLIQQQDSLFVPKGAKTIIVYAITNTKKGTAFFDDIEVKSLSSTETEPTVSNASSEKLSASVTVDTKQKIRVVPATLLGTNVEWIHNGQGLWSETKNRLHPKAISLTKESGFTLLRFPGGVFSDYYFWRDGIGPQSKRPTKLHYPNGPTSVHKFGTDELIDFSSATETDLLITVNVGHGSPQLAADWVKYLNKDKQQNVKLWEIGNELYMDGDLSGAEMNAREYANKFKLFANAMKAVDPSIKLGAIGGLNYGRYAFIKDDDWTEDILERVADKVDFLAVHNAYAPVLIGGGENKDPYEVYKTMMAAPANIHDNLRELDELLTEYETSPGKIEIAITEWGPFFHVLPSSKWVDHVKTLGSSLFVASTLHAFAKEPRVTIANAFKLTDHGFMGWIGNQQDNFKLTAPAIVFSLYKPIINGSVVVSSTSVETFDTSSLGVVNGVNDVPYLDTLAVETTDALYMYVVNKSLTSSVETKINLTNLSQFNDVQLKTVTGSAIDANTGTELPQFPGLVWAEQVSVQRFNRGGDNEIMVIDETKAIGKAGLVVDFPKHSVTRLTFKK